MHTTAVFPTCVLMLGLGLVNPVLAQTNIDSAMTVDNQFTAYLSTDDAVQGTQIGTGNNWPTTYQFSAALTPAVTNYLHIVGTDVGAPAMLIGEFNLDNSGFEFANGTQTLLTNTTHWQVSTTGFGANYFTPSDLGPNGTGPWGSFASIDAAARFIWHPTGPDNTVYFSAQIIPNETGETARATFTVNKDFTDDNPTDVEVTLNCFTGLPLTQTQSISESQNVVFVVTDYDDGELDCEVTEGNAEGYTAQYDNGTTTSSESCEYDEVAFSEENICTITNTPDQVDVNVDKVWVIDGTGGDKLDPHFQLTLICNGQIATFEQNNDGLWRWTVNGNDTGGLGMRASVTPDWDGGTDCWVEETVYDSSVETQNGCQLGSLHIEIGQGASCVITNTVFYEGIPTLSHYGLAVLTLVLLGVGFVGFRRFA